MKQFLSLLLAAALTLSTSACSTPEPSADSGKAPASKQPVTSDAPADEKMAKPFPSDAGDAPSNETESKHDDTSLVIADAALYRGSVTSVETLADGNKKVTLEQSVPGRDFGAEQALFLFSTDTKWSFEESKLQEGVYLEVYYGGTSQDLGLSKPQDAIAVNFCGESADSVLVSGAIQSIQLPEVAGKRGSLLVADSKNGNEIVFHFRDDGTTKIYFDLSQLREGDQVSIYYSGILTRSLPPQGTAKEISLLEEVS